MEKLSPRKQLTIIKLYFSGRSYREIAAKAGVSTGAVASVIADLKAGNYPEAGDISEQVDMLRELAVEVSKSRLTVGEAVTGITIVNSLKELELEPGDIQQCVSQCKTLTPGDVQTQAFVKAAMNYQGALERTGLGVEELDKKVRSLEEASRQLEPLAEKAHDLKKEVEGLEARKAKLTHDVTSLEKRYNNLSGSIKAKEEREANLSTRIAQLEERLQSDEKQLAVTRKDLKALSSIGMSLDELSGFAERLKGIAHRHTIAPRVLYGRLLTELEQLDKGLGLETLVQAKQRELRGFEEAIAKAQEKSVMLNREVQQLQQESASLKAHIADEKENVSAELKKIIAVVQDAVAGFKQDLAEGIKEDLAEVDRLKEKAIETGEELGKFQATINSNAWLEDILSLIRGDDAVTASRVRVIGLMLLRRMLAWLDRNSNIDAVVSPVRSDEIKKTINILIWELERWRPIVTTIEESKSLSAN